METTVHLPKIYIRTYCVSVDSPETNRVRQKQGRLLTKEVKKSPEAPVRVVRTQAGSRPIRSARYPKKILPRTEPIKKKD